MHQPAPLNAFQKLTRQWDAVHPYNAAQVMELAIGPDLALAQSAWDTALARLQLGRAIVASGRYRFEAAAACHVTQLNETTPLEDFLSAALNEPFADAEVPFRPFLQRRTDGCYLGVVYAHWVADSVAIRMVLHAWLRVLIGEPAGAIKPLRLSQDGYWRHFGPEAGNWTLMAGVLSAFRSFNRLRRVRRLSGTQQEDTHQQFRLIQKPVGWIDALRTSAARRGVTVNDLFLAAAAIACARHLPYRTIARRRDVALGMIVDLRPLSAADLSRTFGLFLGFANVVVRPDDLSDVDRLIHRLHRQTESIKHSKSAAMSMVWMWTSLLTGRFKDPQSAYHYYRKHMPLSAGVSNVNLTGTWVGGCYPDVIRRFIRVSPTGPTIPLAITPTTLGSDFHVAYTWRKGMIDDATATQVMTTFFEVLDGVGSMQNAVGGMQ